MADLANRRTLDVSGLPEVSFGRHNVTWLANVLFMTIEGMMFALVIASYFYLRTRATDWPPINTPPALKWGLINTALFVISFIPARYAAKQATRQNRAGVRMGLILLLLMAAVCIVVRVFEFTTLNCRWNDNAYASVVWVLIGMHSGHLATEWIETATLTAISFTDKMEGTRLADVAINSDYWYFVAASGLVVNLIIYGVTRYL